MVSPVVSSRMRDQLLQWIMGAVLLLVDGLWIMYKFYLDSYFWSWYARIASWTFCRIKCRWHNRHDSYQWVGPIFEMMQSTREYLKGSSYVVIKRVVPFSSSLKFRIKQVLKQAKLLEQELCGLSLWGEFLAGRSMADLVTSMYWGRGVALLRCKHSAMAGEDNWVECSPTSR